MLACAVGMRSQQQQTGAAGSAPPPANAWQLTPTPLEESPPTPLEIARGKEADVFGAVNPLDEDPDQPLPSVGDNFLDSNDLREVPVSGIYKGFPETFTILVAQFKSWDAILSPSRRSIYTEIHFAVERVLETPFVSVSQSIDLFLPGGTVQMPSGQVITWDYVPRTYFLRPGDRYLLCLFGGGGPTYDFEVFRSWELANGVAVPNEALYARMAAAGQSQFAGLSEADFIAKVEAEIAAAAEGHL